MKLGVKHQNQQTIVRADFSGGLNTSANVDGIAENQFEKCGIGFSLAFCKAPYEAEDDNEED